MESRITASSAEERGCAEHRPARRAVLHLAGGARPWRARSRCAPASTGRGWRWRRARRGSPRSGCRVRSSASWRPVCPPTGIRCIPRPAGRRPGGGWPGTRRCWSEGRATRPARRHGAAMPAATEVAVELLQLAEEGEGGDGIGHVVLLNTGQHVMPVSQRMQPPNDVCWCRTWDAEEVRVTASPTHVELLVAFANSADHELGTDDLTTRAGLTRWLTEHRTLSRRTPATDGRPGAGPAAAGRAARGPGRQPRRDR